VTAIENLLAPDSKDLPDCKCGADLHLATRKPCGNDTEVRIFRCAACGHELQLMVWSASA
jgi:hypothetical protein